MIQVGLHQNTPSLTQEGDINYKIWH